MQLLRSGQKKFFKFCTQLGKIHQSGSPCPADEWTLCLFGTFLVSLVQHSAIKVYLSAVHALHIEQGFSDPLVNCLQSQRVLREIKRTQGDSSSLCLPITDDIMMVIFRALDLTHPDHCMFWAACNLAYFGFLHSAEFTVPNLASYVPDIHLGVADIVVTLNRLSRAYVFTLRLQKQIFFARLFSAYWQGGVSTLRHFFSAGIFDPEGRCLGPIISVSGGTAFIPCLIDFMVAWHFVCSGYPRQFFQPQLLDWSRNGSSKEWHSGPSNSSLGTLDKLSLFVVHSYGPCGVIVSTG